MAAVLQPGVAIKPVVSQEEVREILSKIYGFQCVSIQELDGYDDKNFHVKVDETADSNYVKSVNKDGYVLKVVNSLDSEKPRCFEAQNELLVYLDKAGICCPTPVRNKNGQYSSIQTFTSGNHIIRLLAFIPGSILHKVPPSQNLFFQCGKYVAQIDEALKNFHHPAYDDHKTIWHLDSVPQLSQFLFAVTDEPRKKLVEEVLAAFCRTVLTASGKLAKGMIHGDFNEQNILVTEQNNTWCVKGALDFGDSQYNCYLYELAIAMTYIMIQGKSLEAGGYVLAGYQSVRNVPEEELHLLKTCIAGRLCQSLVMGAYSHLQDPKNSYILVTSKPGWVLLEELWARPENELLQMWRSVMNSQ